MQQLQRPHDLLVVTEELQGFVNVHRQHLRDVLAAVFDTERFLVVAQAATDLATDPNVGEEVHLYLDLALAFACGAAASGDMEREPAWLEPLLTRQWRRRE